MPRQRHFTLSQQRCTEGKKKHLALGQDIRTHAWQVFTWFGILILSQIERVKDLPNIFICTLQTVKEIKLKEKWIIKKISSDCR